MAQINSLVQTWDLVHGSTWLLTSTAVFSDKDERTLKMRIERGEATLDEAFAERQALVQELHFKIFMDCLRAKNARPVAVASAWTDTSQEGERFVYNFIVNFTNWHRARYHFGFDHYPSAEERTQMEDLKDEYVEETIHDFNDWAEDESLTSHHLLARFNALGRKVEVRGPYTPEELAEQAAYGQRVGEQKAEDRRNRETFLQTLKPPTTEEFAAIRQLVAEGKIPRRTIHIKTED